TSEGRDEKGQLIATLELVGSNSEPANSCLASSPGPYFSGNRAQQNRYNFQQRTAHADRHIHRSAARRKRSRDLSLDIAGRLPRVGGPRVRRSELVLLWPGGSGHSSRPASVPRGFPRAPDGVDRIHNLRVVLSDNRPVS